MYTVKFRRENELILSWFCWRLCVRNPRGKELLKTFHRPRPQGLKRKALGTTGRTAGTRTSVILAGNRETPRHFTTCRSGGNKLSKVRSFIILRSGEGSTSFNNNKSDHFSGKKSTMKLSRPGVYFLRIREKTLNEI